MLIMSNPLSENPLPRQAPPVAVNQLPQDRARLVQTTFWWETDHGKETGRGNAQLAFSDGSYIIVPVTK